MFAEPNLDRLFSEMQKQTHPGMTAQYPDYHYRHH